MAGKHETGAGNVENIDEYEREKIESTVRELEAAAATLRRYQEYADALAVQGIAITENKPRLDQLRLPGGPADPGKSDIAKITRIAEQAVAAADKTAIQHGLNRQELHQKTERGVTRGQLTAALKGDGFTSARQAALQDVLGTQQ